jgi:hypothetical protein
MLTPKQQQEIVEALKTFRVSAPIDVDAFLARKDVPEEAKVRIREKVWADANPADAYRLMAAQVALEVWRLDQSSQ